MGAPDMDELSFTDSQLHFYVKDALKAAIQGDCDFYNQLVAVIHRKERLSAADVALLVTCLKAVTGAVSCIHISHHKSLLAAILRMSLWDYGTNVMDALLELLVALASSNGEHVNLCLEMLVSNFVPPSAYFEKHRGPSKKSEVLDRVHSTLIDIANLVPLSPLILEKIVRDKMPHVYVKEQPIVMYVENMLRLESGAMGELVGSMALIVLMDKLVELDVEIAWKDILEDDFQKDVFDFELEDLAEPADNFNQENKEFTREASMQRFCSGNHPEKLDSLMVLTFEHLKCCFETGRLVQVFEILLQSFRITVLTAYKSKFAQFVMFYACSLDPENCGKLFADALVDIFVNGVHPEWRMSAVAYLASYLARAKFLPVPLIAIMLERVVDWCSKYCKNWGSDINPKAQKVFYAGCQATMYVLCFRMKQMLAIPRLKSQLQLMQIDAILGHPLKPLQVCLPSIVDEFLRQAKENRVCFLPERLADQDFLESKHSTVFGGTEKLGMFFPFDPILLPNCDRYIRPNYVYWSMVRSSYDEEGTSDEDVADAYDCEDGMSIPDDRSGKGCDEEDCDADEFSPSFEKMSITPRDSSHRFGGRMPSRIRPSMSPESL
ncbi:RNA polymerase I-specific transcription initiation factor RRN3-like [Salvia splendens]|uniref:RNA polymerase I-specific transcription initiation factor RRN3-like n=1 Tax=Salvia splendens TaxID=180675 RepID=UPI001C2783A6|nr:RNA polymerase I-specific transcription initiation factor RRN3-like [Salvia splendens]